MIYVNKKSHNPAPRLGSLRHRAIVFASVIGLMVMGFSLLGYFNLVKTSNESSSNLAQRHSLAEKVNQIRTNVLDIYRSLNKFLLDPHNPEHAAAIHVQLKKSLATISDLQQLEWTINNNQTFTVAKLHQTLVLLSHDIEQLFITRLDVTQQYPSLAVGGTVMQPNRNRVNNAFAVAMNELSAENTIKNNPLVYQEIQEARYIWSQLLSNFRLYLANRVGSFNKESLPVQERAIETMHQELEKHFHKLKQFDQQGKLGFETSNALGEMKTAARNWFDGFLRVKVIHHSNEWRNDMKILRDKITPGVDKISQLINQLESTINATLEQDVASYSKVAKAQTLFLWFVAILGMVFIVIMVISLDKLVFQPITHVVEALKSESLGRKSLVLPSAKSKETQDLIEAFSEMSYQVHSRQSELEYLALHDALTSLPNRTLLLDRIEHDIYIARREAHQLSLLMFDLDRFKEVNDTLGHLVGDSLLVEVGARIRGLLRDVDTVARLGGDEFAILLPHTNEEQAIVTAQKISEALSKSIVVDELQLLVKASVGIAIYPIHGTDAQTLMQHADVAMYVAKRNQSGFALYNHDEDEYSITRLSMMNDLRNAIENDELHLHYQPIYDLASGKIIAAEALSRWDHQQFGSIAPEQFVQLAEQTGLMNAMTYWVLEQAIKQVKEWHTRGHDISISINLSVNSLNDDELNGEVRSILRKYAFPMNKLTFEITEGAMMANPQRAIEKLTEFKSMGISLAVDDFGTGFSSLAYLKQLPIDELKIDKSFVIDLYRSQNDEAIVRSTIELAHNLGLGVVAEGVETEVVYQMLHNLKCDAVQGYFMSKPVAGEEFENLLSSAT